jgi:hypothetical protein
MHAAQDHPIVFEIARNVWLHHPLLLLATADEVVE